MTTKKLIQAVVVQWQRSFVTGLLLEFPLLLWRRGLGRGGRLNRNFSVTILGRPRGSQNSPSPRDLLPNGYASGLPATNAAARRRPSATPSSALPGPTD